ncbi:MAG: hypothetical protein JW904_08495 [Spirochaetales bacterium]|nr:hypothetical protein [Spirochaetales bacterium]
MIKRISFITVMIILFFFTSCDFLSNGGDMAQVSIPLLSSEGARAIGGVPDTITVTGYTVRVFGPGMEPIEKKIAAGARSVNMYVPGGQERHFTLEVHFIPLRGFAHPHLQSFIGRATADLRPGYYTKLKFTLHAGASQLFVVDNNNSTGTVWYADSIEWLSPGSTTNHYSPSDVDISNTGVVFVSNDNGDTIGFGDRITSNPNQYSAGTPIRTIAIDRERHYLYYATITNMLFQVQLDPETGIPVNPDTGGLYPAQPLETANLPAGRTVTLQGVAVDPWTGYLYLTALINPGTGNLWAVIKYDPFIPGPQQPGAMLSAVTESSCPQISSLTDVIVKDAGVFVLNMGGIDSAPVPSILKFSRNLHYLGGYGSLSRDATGTLFEASTDPGDFYVPQRFFAIENQGLYIIDDSNISAAPNGGTVDKIIHINEALSSSSWDTYPHEQTDEFGQTLESFNFFL